MAKSNDEKNGILKTKEYFLKQPLINGFLKIQQYKFKANYQFLKK